MKEGRVGQVLPMPVVALYADCVLSSTGMCELPYKITSKVG